MRETRCDAAEVIKCLTVLFYKNRDIAAMVQLEMTLSDALQDDFLTLDRSEVIRRDSDISLQQTIVGVCHL